jgi:signal transduction histidine kinase
VKLYTANENSFRSKKRIKGLELIITGERILEKNGGDIWQSTEGEGSSFFFTFTENL